LHVEQARAAGVLHAEVGDARALPFDDDLAGVVLLLGPLYHLPAAADRSRALGEAARVLRPGGRILAAAISRFASTVDGISRDFLTDAEFEHIVERDVADGRHLNPTHRPGWFTTAYFHRPDELRAELEAAGFEVESLITVEGPGSFAGAAWLEDEDRRATLLRAIRRVETEPSLLGISSHVMAVGRT
ncbi:MAG TPA: methyltransferase domain-containing protein, partial [Acidimicrobiales bacterium]